MPGIIFKPTYKDMILSAWPGCRVEVEGARTETRTLGEEEAGRRIIIEGLIMVFPGWISCCVVCEVSLWCVLRLSPARCRLRRRTQEESPCGRV